MIGAVCSLCGCDLERGSRELRGVCRPCWEKVSLEGWPNGRSLFREAPPLLRANPVELARTMAMYFGARLSSARRASQQQRREGGSQDRAHNPVFAGSTPAPATNGGTE